MPEEGKILGMKKWVFFVLLAGVLILAYILYKRNQQNQDNTAAYQPQPVMGLTAADIGGTPSDTGTPYDVSGGQGVDNSAQIAAMGDQISASLDQLSTQVSDLAGAGLGPSAASSWQSNSTLPTLPIDVTVSTPTTAHHKKKKTHHRHKAKK